MKNTLALVFLFSVLLFSCAKNDCKINLVSEKVEGLDTDAIVTIHGFQVGEVEKVEPINNDKVNIQIDLHRDPAIPADSKFRIENMDFFGTKGITIELGSEKEIIESGDKLYAVKERIPMDDKLRNRISTLLDHISKEKSNDSLIYELQRLNDNLEHFNLKKL